MPNMRFDERAFMISLFLLSILPAVTTADASRHFGSGGTGNADTSGFGHQRWGANRLSGAHMIRFQHVGISDLFPNGTEFESTGREVSEALQGTRLGLKDLAGPEMLIGSLVGWGNYFPLADTRRWKAQHRAVLLRECSAGTATCYPTGTWTGIKQYDLSRFNESVNWLHENGKTVIAHLLVGPQHYYPREWFGLKNGIFTQESLEDMLEDYIRTIITSNDNDMKVGIWNVVNEALYGDDPRDGPPRYRPCRWNELGWEEDASGLPGESQVLKRHPVWVRKAFEYARKYTSAKLEYRDNNCAWPNGKIHGALYQLMRHLKNTGVPVDGVGFQAHAGIGRDYDWDGFRRQVKRMQDLGLEVYVMEVDVRGSTNSAEDREEQRQMYYNLVKACRESGVNVLNFWGMRDSSGGGGNNEYHFLFEGADYLPKPAYYGVQQALRETR